MARADDAVRNYLLAVREPEALKDDEAAKQRRAELRKTQDPIERLRLQQAILDAQQVDPKRYEADFVAHAKEWAETTGVSQAAFRAEGVEDAVLRRAGFRIRRAQSGRRRASANAGTRARVTSEEVRKALPRGTFTIKDVQDASGASTAVVRRVIQEEVDAGKVSEKGTDPNHQGPGRAPMLYSKP